MALDCAGSAALQVCSERVELRAIPGGRSRDHGSKTDEVTAQERSHVGWLTRATLVLAFVALCAADVCAGKLIEARRDKALAEVSTETYIVEEGATLWSIAERHLVSGSTTSDIVSWIMERNGLASSCVGTGMSLEVPVAQES